ncbi:MAG: hypothetical protein QNJ68_00210 [Microcoleaceae cyanobacterium MO_207.B10]|nr:hypothetical protein [Microcoleaceae cyanobacterium MO_207.B10]
MVLQEDGLYQLQVKLPRPLQDKYGQKIQLKFSVDDQKTRSQASPFKGMKKIFNIMFG